MNNSVTVTPEALVHLQQNLASSPEGTIGIRVGLRDAGCSGFAYTVDFANDHQPDDQVFDHNGVKIIIAAQHFNALKGTQIDLVKQGMNSILAFNNPNVQHECGCGESFQIKE